MTTRLVTKSGKGAGTLAFIDDIEWKPPKKGGAPDQGTFELVISKDPCGVTERDVKALDAATVNEVSSILEMPRLVAARVVGAFARLDHGLWTYRQDYWEGVAAPKRKPAEGEADPGDERPDPRAEHAAKVEAARAAGATSTQDYAKAMGVSLPSARSWLREAGAAEVRDGRGTTWSFDPETSSPEGAPE